MQGLRASLQRHVAASQEHHLYLLQQDPLPDRGTVTQVPRRSGHPLSQTITRTCYERTHSPAAPLLVQVLRPWRRGEAASRRGSPTGWRRAGGVILLTAFPKTRSAETAEVARALHAQKVCEAEHGTAHQVFDREVN